MITRMRKLRVPQSLREEKGTTNHLSYLSKVLSIFFLLRCNGKDLSG